MKDGKSNICAILGFILTFVNLAASVALIIFERGSVVLISAPLTALVSLVLSICGVSRAKQCGKGKGLSITGIVLNILILIAAALLIFVLFLFVQACSGIFQGLNPNN